MRPAIRLLCSVVRPAPLAKPTLDQSVHASGELSVESQLLERRQKIRQRISQLESGSVYVPPFSPFQDNFGRQHTYLRISLTEKCNLRCLYCMPEEGVPLKPNSQMLTADEIVRLTSVFAQHGVDKVRITGGEPSVRKDFMDIISRVSKVPGIRQVGITTNGVALHRHLEELKAAGLDMLNISLDTLDADKFTMITRRNGLKHVMKTIRKAEELYEFVKINTVMMKGVNDSELFAFIDMTRDRNLAVRFIEFMPFGGNKFSLNKFVSYSSMLEKVKEAFGDDLIRLVDTPNDTNKAYKIKGYKGEFGFITSMTEHFCGSCNRVRVTADGNLKVCLHGNAEVSLRDVMRDGASDEELSGVIQAAVSRKKKQHADVCQLVTSSGFSCATSGFPSPSFFQSSSTSICKNSKIFARSLLSMNHNVHYASRRLSSSYCDNDKLTHTRADGSAHQVDVSGKEVTRRSATAVARVQVTPEIMEQIRRNSLKKGDVMAVARIAGIQGAKQTATLIPLCHQLPLTHCTVDFDIHEETCSLLITCSVSTVARTGVEMEALTGVSVAALTLYDMCKAVSHEMVIQDIRVISKSGGKRDFSLSAPSSAT